MRVLFAFLLLAATGFGSDWTGLVASELAFSTLGVKQDDRVPRSQCTTCKGAGKVRAGDGRTIVWRACDRCYNDSDSAEVDGEAENLQDEEADEADDESDPRILFFTAPWCGPCQQIKRRIFPVMIEAGWRISAREDGHIQIVDGDHLPELAARYRVTTYPTFIVVHGDQEQLRHTGYLDSWGIRRLWDNATHPSGNNQ